MNTKNPQPHPSVPQFASREEEAAFWDTHDITNFTADTKPVRMRLKKPLGTGITMRLDTETLKQLQEKAAAKGIGPSSLARMWLLERLHQEHLAGGR